MRALGVVRKIDELGRVVIPVEVRRRFGIDVKDSVEIYIDDNDSIILKKYEPACIFCNSTKELNNVFSFINTAWTLSWQYFLYHCEKRLSG